MTIKERLAIIETDMKSLKKMIYALFFLIAGVAGLQEAINLRW